MHSVLMLCPNFHPIIGGAERQAGRLAHALTARGHRVTILTPLLAKNSAPSEKIGEVKVIRFPYFDLCAKFPRVRGLGALNLALLSLQTREAIRSHLEQASIVYAFSLSAMTALGLNYARRAGKRTVARLSSSGEIENDFLRLRRMVFGNMIADSAKRDVDAWVAVSDAVRNTLIAEEIPTTTIRIIANGVESKAVQRVGVKPVRNFLYLGRLSRACDRDLHGLLRAFIALCEDLPERVEFAFVGDGDLRDELGLLAGASRFADRIRFPGWQDPETWLLWADCFVLPSRREGMSNALIEAMACNLPCIVNDIPANREVLDDGRAGTLVPVGNQDFLVSAMRHHVEEPEFAAKMATAGLLRARELYSITWSAAEHESLFCELVSK